MQEIIAFIGVIGSGKDFQSQLKIQEGYVRVDFKDELLDMASDLVGYDVRADYDWFKTHVVGIRRPYDVNDVPAAEALSSRILLAFPEAMTGRRLLQRLGTDAIRKRHPNYWAEAFRKKVVELINKENSVVCADCRFANEIATIFAIGVNTGAKVKFVFCDFHSDRYDPNGKHESERLAQELLNTGLVDGQIVNFSDFSKVCPEAAEEFLHG